MPLQSEKEKVFEFQNLVRITQNVFVHKLDNPYINYSRFCNLCESLKTIDRDMETYIQNEGPDQCNSTSKSKNFILKVRSFSFSQPVNQYMLRPKYVYVLSHDILIRFLKIPSLSIKTNMGHVFSLCESRNGFGMANIKCVL